MPKPLRRSRPLNSAARKAASTLFAGALSLASLGAHAQANSEVSPPTVLSHVDAQYPGSALTTRKHADVVLAVTVDVHGHVIKVDLVESGGDDLDEAAIIAVRQWTFVPAKRGDRAVASRIRVPFHFAPPEPAPEEVPTAAPSGEPELPSQQATPAAPPPSPAPAPTDAQRSDANEAGPEQVRVLGRTAPPSRGASDFNVRIGDLANVPRANASEMLKLAPGILLTNEGGEGHAEQVFLRGFDAREGQDIEFSVGGVPINESGNLHGNGYADTHFIIPELVESLRVVEGPFDPRQGNYAVAGSANYELGLEKRGLTVKGTAGSWGTKRLLLLWGPNSESTHTFAGAEVYSTDGFGQNRDASRASAMGQYEGALGEKGSYRITAQGFSTHYHSAGQIRQDDFKAGRIGFYDSYDQSSFAREQTTSGGDSSRFSLAADLETHVDDTRLSQQVFVIKRGMRILENFTGFLLDVQEPLQRLHVQRGDMLDLNVDETTVGAKGSARFRGKALGQPQELELGYFARGDWVHGTQQRLEATSGIPYATDTDLESQLSDIGLYADANAKALSWLTLRGGLRADAFGFNVDDLCAARSVAHPAPGNLPLDQSCLDQQDFGRHRETNSRAATSSIAILPRGSLIFGPFQHLSLNVSAGKGVRSVDPNYITQDVKTPFASVVSYEGGATYASQVKSAEITAKSIFFQTHVDRDLIFSQTAGRNVLGAGTTRSGWSGAVRVTGTFFDESANVTLVKSSYDDTHLLVAYVPDIVFRSDTALFTDMPFRIAGRTVRGTLNGGVTYVGPRALPFGQRSQDIFTVDASATLTWRNYELGLLSTNLFDRRYRLSEFNYASDFHSQAQPTLVPERHFTAGAPRGVFATLAITFGGPT